MRKKIGSALVVGAGISGIRSALDLAEEGYHITLIDKAPNLGGVLTQLDHQFPTDHCGMCKMLPLVERDASSQFCLRKGLFHENIDILLSTELAALEGEPGKFQATLRSKPTMVDPTKCIGCGECARVCPVEVPYEFNAGLTKRKAVYLPVPHSIPNTYIVDIASCIQCGECEKVCPTGAVDFGKEARGRFRILVVDDELVVRDSLKEWLQDEGFQVEMAESGEEALSKITAEPFNLVLLDIKMPGMDGVEVLKRSKELRPESRVVMMTAYATVETAVEAMKIGAMDYLMKPFDPDGLIPLILQLYQSIEKTGEHKVEVGSVVLAGGFESYDPSSGKNTYGYGVLPNVVTSVQFERIISGTGLFQGKLVRPGDGKPVKRIAWLQCVGSRDRQSESDFCSSACCMFAVKEAVLAKEKSNGLVDASIFYMDMRTFGKDFQRYRDRAEKELGVRFVRNRIHSVEPAGDNGDLKLTYVDKDGKRREEIFDLVVLAAGQRPSSGTRSLSEVAGFELNPWGFCRVDDFHRSRTTRDGIFAGGSFSGLRDISESVVQAGSAALEASRLIHSKGGSLAEETPEIEYRDVSRELPRASVFLCTCGQSGEGADLDAVIQEVQTLGSVKSVHRIEFACTQEGWAEIRETIAAEKPNRVLIAACMPYAYIPRLRKLGETVGLNPALMEVVDTRSGLFPAEPGERGRMSMDMVSTISMGLGRLKGVDPRPKPLSRVIHKALVVGGGITGMTSALAIADHGFEVHLVEQSEELGGIVGELHRTIEGRSPGELLEATVARVEKHPKIHVHKKSRIAHSQGRVGRFITTIETDNGTGLILEHGVAILSTGAKEAKTQSYEYGKSDAVLTQHELEKKLADGALHPGKLSCVAMIQCVDSREEPRNYCSRICCASALKNALYLKEKNPELDVYILYRDIMSYGFLETYYSRAREAGVIFINFEPARKPSVRVMDGSVQVVVADPILEREFTISPDLLVLSTGIVPNEAGELARIFGLELNQDGFYREAEYKWRPVDTIKEGIYIAGTAHSPRFIGEAVAMAEAAAQRSLRILGSDRVASGGIVAEVRHSLCSLCERCIAACPYGARVLVEEERKIIVDELMCQGCGSCAAVCPNSAAVLRGYKDQNMFEVIDAALEAL